MCVVSQEFQNKIRALGGAVMGNDRAKDIIGTPFLNSMTGSLKDALRASLHSHMTGWLVPTSSVYWRFMLVVAQWKSAPRITCGR